MGKIQKNAPQRNLHYKNGSTAEPYPACHAHLTVAASHIPRFCAASVRVRGTPANARCSAASGTCNLCLPLTAFAATLLVSGQVFLHFSSKSPPALAYFCCANRGPTLAIAKLGIKPYPELSGGFFVHTTDSGSWASFGRVCCQLLADGTSDSSYTGQVWLLCCSGRCSTWLLSSSANRLDN